MTEAWRPVREHPGYEVSDLGRVRSLDRWVDYPNGRGLGKAPLRLWVFGKLLKLNRVPSGHLTVKLPGRRTQSKVHHLVLEAFVGPRPPGAEARHLDGDPANNRVMNLRWDNRRENSLDRKFHRGRPGEVRPHG